MTITRPQITCCVADTDRPTRPGHDYDVRVTVRLSPRHAAADLWRTITRGHCPLLLAELNPALVGRE